METGGNGNKEEVDVAMEWGVRVCNAVRHVVRLE